MLCWKSWISLTFVSSRNNLLFRQSIIARSMGRKQQQNKKSPGGAKQNIEYDISVHQGMRIRSVKPYVHTFQTFAKGRWLGRQLLEVVSREFGGHPQSYWEGAIDNGHIRINDKAVPRTYVIKNSDRLIHCTHRHEPPVFGEIAFVGETSSLFAVSKPASIPMHACGAYRFNSLEYVLKHDPIVANQPTNLLLVHRLDRVTSGVVVMAKSKDQAAAVGLQIRDKRTEKVYLARVKGSFPTPEQHYSVPHLNRLSHIDLSTFVTIDDDSDDTSPSSSASCQQPSTDIEVGEHKLGNKSIDNGRVETRELQENNNSVDAKSSNKRRKLAPEVELGTRLATGAGATEMTTTTTTTALLGSKQRQQQQQKKEMYGKGKDVNLADLPPAYKSAPPLAAVAQSDNVGYIVLNSKHRRAYGGDVNRQKEGDKFESTGILYDEDGGNNEIGRKMERESGGEGASIDGEDEYMEIALSCPLACISHREGVHACDPDNGKPSLSFFRFIGYDEGSDTSLVECRPFTGRTHQLRLHLQLLGCPIANDPCYGGELFYGEEGRRAAAVDALRHMRANEVVPLSKIPHFSELEEKQVEGTEKAAATSGAGAGARVDATAAAPVASQPKPDTPPYKLADETYEEYLERTCRHCVESRKCGGIIADLEHLLHCDGIYLHALRYSYKPASTSTVATGAQLQVENSEGTVAPAPVTNIVMSAAASSDDAEGSSGGWIFESAYPTWAKPFLSYHRDDTISKK